MTSLNHYPLGEGLVSPISQFKYSLDSFYVTDSHLSVTNIPYSRENNDRLFYSEIAHLCGTDYVG